MHHHVHDAAYSLRRVSSKHKQECRESGIYDRALSGARSDIDAHVDGVTMRHEGREVCTSSSLVEPSSRTTAKLQHIVVLALTTSILSVLALTTSILSVMLTHCAAKLALNLLPLRYEARQLHTALEQ